MGKKRLWYWCNTKWNFHKIIIGRDGKIEETFSSITKPSSKKFVKVIENLI